MRRSGFPGLFVSLYNWYNPKTNTSGGAPYGITWEEWVCNHGKIWKKMSELPVQSYLSLVTETGSRFAGSKSELISGASSSAVKFYRMISSVF